MTSSHSNLRMLVYPLSRGRVLFAKRERTT